MLLLITRPNTKEAEHSIDSNTVTWSIVLRTVRGPLLCKVTNLAFQMDADVLLLVVCVCVHACMCVYLYVYVYAMFDNGLFVHP